jgi:hypothetical protein
MKKSKKTVKKLVIFFTVFTRCDIVGTWSREYQSSSSSSYSYYQMQLCCIWSRNAENSSALLYVVKRVTKSHVFLWCRHSEFLQPFSTFMHMLIYAFGSMHLLDSSSYSHLRSLIYAYAAKKNKTRQEKRIQANTSSASTFRPVLSSYWSNARMGKSSNPNKSQRSVFDATLSHMVKECRKLFSTVLCSKKRNQKSRLITIDNN